MRTRLGISVGLLGAATYLAAYFDGFFPVLVIAGYVLMFEENEWLRRTVVKAAAVMFCFSFLIALIGLLPDVLGIIGTTVAMFDGTFSYGVVNSIVSIVYQILEIIRTCLFLMLGAKALNQGTVAVPFVDKLINKYF